MHVDAVPNRGSRPAYLLRESFREGAKVKKRTLANLSSLPDEQIFAIRAVLRGEKLHPVGDLFEAIASRLHGHVQAVRVAMQRLGFESLLASRRSRERDLVCAMVAARIIAPHTKLATTRWWHTTTLAEEFDVTDADEDDLYTAMDWLLERQGAIEKKLAARHLGEGSLVLYDLSSSYFEGITCPLAKLGHNRDGKKGKLQVNYGLLTDRRGRPVGVSVYDGNTNDPKDLHAAGRQAQEGLRHPDPGPGRGPRDDFPEGDRRAQGARAHRLDHGTQDRPDSSAGGRWTASARAVRREEPLRAFAPRLSFGAPDRLPQSGPSEAARSQAPVPARGYREGAREGQGDGRAGTSWRPRRDRGARRQGRQQVQGRQAFRPRHRGAPLRLPSARAEHRLRSCPRRHLRHPHERCEKADDGRRLRAQLQVTGRGRAGLPLDEDHRSEDPAHSPPSRRPGQKPHLPLHARLLRRVAHARGLASVALRRRGSTRQDHPRSGGSGETLRSRRSQGRLPSPRRRHPRTQLRHSAAGAR